MMDCKECRALIDAYLDDELTRDVKEQFTAHISSCDACKEELAFAEGVKNTLSSLPEIEVPADFTEKLSVRLKAEKKHKPFVRYAARYGALAACIILAVVLGSGIVDTDFSNEFDFSGEDITDISGTTADGQDYAGEIAPTNDKENEPKLIVPRGSEKVPEGTPVPAKSRMADTSSEDLSLKNDTEDVTALIEAYELDEDEEPVQDMASTPIEITVSGEDEAFVKELALIYAELENGSYTAEKESFNSFIAELSECGITFTQSTQAEADTVVFEISVE